MTLLDWMLYAAVVSAVVGLTGWSLDGVLRVMGRPSRWIWPVTLTISLVVPAAATFLDSSLPVTSGGTARESESTLESNPGPIVPTATGFRPSAALEDAQAWLARSVVRGSEALSYVLSDEASIRRAWISASLALTLFLAIAFGRISFEARTWKQSTILGREVWITRAVGPATIGLFRQRVVLPEWATQLAPGELALVLAHEEEHARTRDPMLLGLTWIPLIAMPWNPFLWWQVRALSTAVEVDCDRRVLRNGSSRRDYMALLIRLAARARGDHRPLPSIVRFTSPLKRRMEAMIGQGRSASVSALAALLVGVMLSAVACGPRVPGVIGETASPQRHFAFPVDVVMPVSPIAEALRDGAPAVIVLGPGPIPATARTCEYLHWRRDATETTKSTGVGHVVDARCVPLAGAGDVVLQAVPNAPMAPENSPPCVYSEPDADSVITRPGVIWYGRPWGPYCGPRQQPLRHDLVPSSGPPS